MESASTALRRKPAGQRRIAFAANTEDGGESSALESIGGVTCTIYAFGATTVTFGDERLRAATGDAAAGP
jgi:hypothetical protein